ncbi:MAG: hypothetical protein C0434_05075 [Xanthomonadaceae bacterium]|nr:hypothetical protein [Xanthomonadaceae bacterium]
MELAWFARSRRRRAPNGDRRAQAAAESGLSRPATQPASDGNSPLRWNQSRSMRASAGSSRPAVRPALRPCSMASATWMAPAMPNCDSPSAAGEWWKATASIRACGSPHITSRWAPISAWVQANTCCSASCSARFWRLASSEARANASGIDTASTTRPMSCSMPAQ